jgi:hypothetical protein
MTYLADVDTSISLTQSMAISKFGDDRDGIQTGILSKGGWDHFQGIGIGLEAVGFHSFERLSVLRKQARNVDFRGTTTTDESAKIDRNEIVRESGYE